MKTLLIFINPSKRKSMKRWTLFLILFNSIIYSQNFETGSKIEPAVNIIKYADNRPSAEYRLNAQDIGIIFRHGLAPDSCDYLGARDVWIWKYQDKFYMHYDGAGPKGWLTCLAESKDLVNWIPKGKVMEFGDPGSKDCASSSYGTVYFDGIKWHMFYLGTPNTSGAPEYVPAFPYQTLKAESNFLYDPWKKRYDITPFSTMPNTYYSSTASPGCIIKQGNEYLMFFSAGTNNPVTRTLGIARTKNLDSCWTLDDKPVVPSEEQVENSSLYYEEVNKTYFLFTNHVGIKDNEEYTDAIWVYWTQDLNNWDPENKAVVLDSLNCKWSKIIGLPSVIAAGGRLVIFYDGKTDFGKTIDVKTHMERDIGIACLNLPLIPPIGKKKD
jgi:predicted GH43/DUF377 family glycosyl hydrolase